MIYWWKCSERTEKVTLNEYQKLAMRTAPKSGIESHALHLLSAEVGELHGIYQKRIQGHTDTDEHRLKELGDILWGVAEYATSQGWNLDDVAMVNIEKLKARYPDGFDTEHSLHRRKGDI